MSKLSNITGFWRNRNEYESIFTREKISAFFRMVPLMFRGDYRPKKKRNLFLGLAAVVYLISPIDIIPELVFGPFGLIDDVAILLFALRRIDKEVINFLTWEEEQKNILFVD